VAALSVNELIQKGESQTVEFKKSLSLQTEGLASLCGMLNTERGEGTVIFGVAPDGAVCGIEPGDQDSAQQKLSQRINDKFEPPVMVDMQIEKVQWKPVLILRASRSSAIPFHEFDGRAFIRIGTTTRTLSLAEKTLLQKKRDRNAHSGPWKCDKCGSWVGVLASFEFDGKSMRKSFKCGCGGEFWPAM
jgi:predicted HTH transcriptional regulator